MEPETTRIRQIFESNGYMIDGRSTNKTCHIYYVYTSRILELRPLDIVNLFAPHGINVTSVGVSGDDLVVTIARQQAERGRARSRTMELEQLDRWEQHYLLQSIGRSVIDFPSRSKVVDRMYEKGLIAGVGIVYGHYVTFAKTDLGNKVLRDFVEPDNAV